MTIRTSFLVLCLMFAPAIVATAQVPAFDHVFVIVLENQEYGNIIGNASAPYINSLATQYGVETNDFAVMHPSLPNYMAMTGGETAFTDDCVGCVTSGANIADTIEASGRTWMAYMEDMPAPCATADSGLYATKHNPFIHYSDIVDNPARCASHDVPFTGFADDLSSGRLANYVWITPNLCHNMHDCPVATGDAWLSTIIPQILQSPSFKNSVLLLAWDEGTTNAGGGGHVPLVVASPLTPAGTQVGAAATDYSLLRTIEDAWQLAPLGNSATTAALWQFFPAPSPVASDQVIYASDAMVIGSQWSKVADPTAAGGVKLTTPDNGAPALTAPLPSPPSYAEATFNAVAGTRYRVWVRIHPIGDSKWNDSLFEQFSDSVDSSGAPIYRIGTSSGLMVNLWTCADCQTTGWGWQRNAYRLPDTGDVWFETGGTHVVRVQVREDGVEIDQIVISPTTYANNAPGAPSNDHTIVPKPAPQPGPTPTPTPTPTPAPSGNIVIYASDVPATALHGGWTPAADATSPNGIKLITPDDGLSNTNNPLASPAQYFDLTFTASAGTPYTLWLRTQALNNSKLNDSVWVQFSDALAGGSPIYQLNTTQGLLVNLATDSGATSLNAWGWDNGAYWLSQPTTVTFANNGTHTLRIQTREDGVELDQVVLSPSTYLSSPPGPVGGDQTIVPKS